MAPSLSKRPKTFKSRCRASCSRLKLCQWIPSGTVTPLVLAKPSSGPRIWSGGRPKIFIRVFADVAKRSRASEASQYWPGSRAHLRALEALAFLTLKYAFSHFSWYFFFKIFNVHLCGYINKCLFQHERFWLSW